MGWGRFARPRKPARPEIALRRLARSPHPCLRASSRTERNSAPTLRVFRPSPDTEARRSGGTRKFTERVEESRCRLGFKRLSGAAKINGKVPCWLEINAAGLWSSHFPWSRGSAPPRTKSCPSCQSCRKTAPRPLRLRRSAYSALKISPAPTRRYFNAAPRSRGRE